MRKVNKFILIFSPKKNFLFIINAERYVDAFESVVNGVIIVKEELQRISDERERTD